jgi:hypothetical protein
MSTFSSGETFGSAKILDPHLFNVFPVIIALGY